MELTDSLKALFMDTARSLNGSARRLFMARTVKERGPGGQRHATHSRGWSRGTIRHGNPELTVVSRVWMLLLPVVVSLWKPTCPPYCAICKPSSLARVRRSRSFARHGSLRV